MRIPIAEVEFSKLSVMDKGRVFRWKGGLYRAIHKEYCEFVRELFGSGLINALVKAGVFVPSNLTDLELEGYGLVVQHHPLPVVSYPREWSYSMLKDAALLVLRLNEISAGYGYQTNDCHGYNVLFDEGRPIYIDLGSFVRAHRNEKRLQSFCEFLRAYYYPLRIWASLGPIWGARTVPRPGFLLQIEDYLKFRWRFLRSPFASAAATSLSRVYAVCSVDEDTFMELKAQQPAWKGRLAEILRKMGSSISHMDRMQKRISKMQRRTSNTSWSSYHDSFRRQSGEITLTPRFQYVVRSIGGLGVSSVLEIAGNQGILSRELKRQHAGLRVTCTDADELAIDKGYRHSKADGIVINWAVLNPFFTDFISSEESPVARFRAEAVVALALSHHLILSMGLTLGWILDVLSEYSSRFVLIEFMPLGLFDGKASPGVPAWYTKEWFQEEFEARFALQDCVQLEPNRVLFVGGKGDSNRGQQSALSSTSTTR